MNTLENIENPSLPEVEPEMLGGLAHNLSILSTML
jgi:hypothetical protein